MSDGRFLSPQFPRASADHPARFQLHDLGDGQTFFSGALPPELLWSAAQFEGAWALHPEVSPHRDSTVRMIRGCPIVTVSFGETRTFRLTRGTGPPKRTLDFPAPAGTVFVLPYATNEVWKHGVTKSVRYSGRRISVTLRGFVASD